VKRLKKRTPFTYPPASPRAPFRRNGSVAERIRPLWESFACRLATEPRTPYTSLRAAKRSFGLEHEFFFIFLFSKPSRRCGRTPPHKSTRQTDNDRSEGVGAGNSAQTFAAEKSFRRTFSHRIFRCRERTAEKRRLADDDHYPWASRSDRGLGPRAGASLKKFVKIVTFFA